MADARPAVDAPPLGDGRPTPLRLVDRQGVDWAVWDVVDGRCETPGVFATGQRVFERVADRAPFACAVDPRVRPALRTDPATLECQLREALAIGPLPRHDEPTGAYLARRAEYFAARRSAPGSPARPRADERASDAPPDAPHPHERRRHERRQCDRRQCDRRQSDPRPPVPAAATVTHVDPIRPR